ncbi:MAG: UDP-N-acetylmuramoyl-tripeptide--D-alanyl-D-alanine ligase [Bacteriovoracaceae bacterium]|nr:UDP-N-acetylmuramoyl-tripeptide--D-alanyl-D-alanine ligase [Bacteriovoracaceae bacterium]
MIKTELLITMPEFKKCQTLKGGLDLNFSSDTRHYKDGLFLAITGEKYNAVDYLESVLNKGCQYIVYTESESNNEKVKKISAKYPKTFFTATNDSVAFLQRLASIHTEEFSKKKTIVGISGSNGKTTNKEMLFHLLDYVAPKKVIKTEANNNNHIGVPLTVLSIQRETEIAIIELGSNHPGEMKVVCDIANPNYGIVTNIGATHLEFFETEAAVFKEEGVLYYSVKDHPNKNKFFLMNMDDQFTQTYKKESWVQTFGLSHKSEAVIQIDAPQVKITTKDYEVVLKNTEITGGHNYFNLAACFLMAHKILPTKKEQLVKAAGTFVPKTNRSSWIKHHEKDVFLDAYNANPSSMKAAIKSFAEHCQSKSTLSKSVVVLGDMNELGKTTEQYHKEVASFLSQFDFPMAFFVGRYANFYADSYSKKFQTFKDVGQLKSQGFSKAFASYDYLFIKGSRSLQLESLLDINEHT